MGAAVCSKWVEALCPVGTLLWQLLHLMDDPINFFLDNSVSFSLERVGEGKWVGTLKWVTSPLMVVHACNPSTLEAKAGRLDWKSACVVQQDLSKIQTKIGRH